MAVPAVRLESRHWLYLDDERTHEVHVQVTPEGGRASVTTTEFPVGSRDPAEVVQTNVPVRGERELLELLADVEERLALSGRYYRSDVSPPALRAGDARGLRWTPLPPPRRRDVDLRAIEAALPGSEAKMRFHHFHGARQRDRLLIDMPRADVEKRHVLAAMDFEFPYVDRGSLEILHTRLSPQTLRGAIVREHLEAPRKGYEKLFDARAYERAYGQGWLDATRSMLVRATARLVGGPAPLPAPAARATLPPEQVERIRAAVLSPPVEAKRDRFVDGETRARLVAEGEHAIRRHVTGLRRVYSHAVAYDLSLVEAALLVEYALPSQMWDLAGEEGAKLLRFLHGCE